MERYVEIKYAERRKKLSEIRNQVFIFYPRKEG